MNSRVLRGLYVSALCAILAACRETVTPLELDGPTGPTGGTLVFRYLDAGSYHSCGIATTETLHCWGYNGDGQLGLSPSHPVLSPTEIVDDERFRLVTGGRYHSCGITLSGEASCWGEDKDGRLGQRPFATTFQYAQAGYVHTCALSLAREVWCWGYNGEGELARNPNDTFVDTTGVRRTLFSSATPCVLWGGVPCGEASPANSPLYKALTVNGLHSCAIRENGQADCWGFGAEGQLGNGGTATKTLPTPVESAVAFRTEPTVAPPVPDPDFPLPSGPFIAAGFAHTCAISVGGPTYCWGLNENGQLGTGNFASSTVPREVSGSGGLEFIRITAGQSHTCGLTAAGAAHCWGDNTFGQIGDGTKSTAGTNDNDRSAPTPVSGGLTFAYLKAGELHTCGVTTAGVAYCWGDNEYGQLGNGTTTASPTPSKVAGQP